MSSKIIILERIRKNKPEIKPPSYSYNPKNNSLTNGHKVECFKENLVKVGAEMIGVNSKNELKNYMEKYFSDAVNFTKIAIREKYSSATSKEEIEKTKAVIIKGQFGVAENGAIWIDETNFPNRLLPFIAEQLIMVVDKKNILNNMQEAYRKISIDKTGFGVFISGPSKTADIEQSLVYGAHGAKEVFVILY